MGNVRTAWKVPESRRGLVCRFAQRLGLPQGRQDCIPIFMKTAIFFFADRENLRRPLRSIWPGNRLRVP